MQTRIDSEGGEFEIVDRAEDLSTASDSLVLKEGLWVIEAQVPPDFDAVRAIQEEREERIRGGLA